MLAGLIIKGGGLKIHFFILVKNIQSFVMTYIIMLCKGVDNYCA
jgi:hypothetical protein